MNAKTPRGELADPAGLARFIPRLAALAGCRAGWLRSGVAAGLSVAAVALPVGIAYAGIAGVPPVVSIYSAIFPLFAHAFFGFIANFLSLPILTGFLNGIALIIVVGQLKSAVKAFEDRRRRP